NHEILWVYVTQENIQGVQVLDLLKERDANINKIGLRPVRVDAPEPGGTHDRRLKLFARSLRHGVTDERTVGVGDQSRREPYTFRAQGTLQKELDLRLAMGSAVILVKDLDHLTLNAIHCVDRTLSAFAEEATEL